jgi:hypothetical protein
VDLDRTPSPGLVRPWSGLVLGDVVRLLVGGRAPAGLGGLGEPGGCPAPARPHGLGQYTLGGPLAPVCWSVQASVVTVPVDEDPISLRQ